MNLELTIKVKLQSEFEVYATPNLEHFNEATDEQRSEYVREKVKDFLLENIDDVIDELMDDIKIEY